MIDGELKELLQEKCEEHNWDFEKALKDLELWFENADQGECDFCRFDEWYEEAINQDGEEVFC